MSVLISTASPELRSDGVVCVYQESGLTFTLSCGVACEGRARLWQAGPQPVGARLLFRYTHQRGASSPQWTAMREVLNAVKVSYHAPAILLTGFPRLRFDEVLFELPLVGPVRCEAIASPNPVHARFAASFTAHGGDNDANSINSVQPSVARGSRRRTQCSPLGSVTAPPANINDTGQYVRGAVTCESLRLLPHSI